MAENSIVRAPYNFVPFSDKILLYQGEPPAHDSVDPTLKTGEIHVTLKAVTPVFVSDGNREDPHFFRGPNGKFMLPGSTVRGMVRQNMQVLSFGLVRAGEDIEDKRAFYRKIADARGSTGGELKEYYHSALAVKSLKSPSGKTYSVPENVKAGYLRRSKDGFYIQPVSGSYLKVSKEILSSVGLGDSYASAMPVDYAESAGGFVRKVQRAGNSAPAGMKRGMLLCPGVDAGGDGTRGNHPKPPSHRYIFPLADENAAPVGISKEDELSYAADWEDRKNSLKGGTQLQGRKILYDPDFWKLPKEGEEKPVFYIRHNGHTFFGMALYLRIGYHFSLRDGLPQSHRELEERTDVLDYPRAILGYAQKERSYRSRVSFGDFSARGDPEEQALVETVLGNPKISYYPGYVVDGKHYNQENFRLRGYKHYWLKEAKATPTDKKNAASRMRPLPEGTVFSGVIRFKNLRPEELGLLLWALRLEEGCYQTVGMGKPYGYGRMELTIDGLQEFDLASLYRPDNLGGGAAASSETAVQEYISLYDAFAVQTLGFQLNKKELKQKKNTVSLRDRSGVKELLYLHSIVRDPGEVSYMDLKEYQNVRNALPDVPKVRKDLEAAAQEKQKAGETVQALEEDNSIEAMRAMLARKFNKR